MRSVGQGLASLVARMRKTWRIEVVYSSGEVLGRGAKETKAQIQCLPRKKLCQDISIYCNAC